MPRFNSVQIPSLNPTVHHLSIFAARSKQPFDRHDLQRQARRPNTSSTTPFPPTAAPRSVSTFDPLWIVLRPSRLASMVRRYGTFVHPSNFLRDSYTLSAFHHDHFALAILGSIVCMRRMKGNNSRGGSHDKIDIGQSLKTQADQRTHDVFICKSCTQVRHLVFVRRGQSAGS